MSIKVFTTQELVEAVKANPKKVFYAEKKKDDKAYKGTKFLNLFFDIAGEVKKTGWFNIKGIVLSDGVADPANKQDPRNEFEGTRMQLQTTVRNAGAFGEAILALNPEWHAMLDDLIANGSINATGRKKHDLVRLTLSENNVKNPGAKIEDPGLSFKIDFRPYPATYQPKFLAGQPRTQFFDYRETFVDKNGKTQYKPAMVEDPDTEKMVPVTERNLHLFATKGSIIHEGRINWPSISVSSSWISGPMIANRIVLEPGCEEGFTDEGAPESANAVIRNVVTVVETDDFDDTKDDGNNPADADIESVLEGL